MRRIPSLKRIQENFRQQFEHDYGLEAEIKLKALRALMEGWRDRGITSQGLMRAANDYLEGHGIEYLESDNGRASAYYVNMGDPYVPTVLLDTQRGRVFIDGSGDWIEAEERRGNRFS